MRVRAGDKQRINQLYILMILGVENIAAVFSIFHDGGIDSCSRMNGQVQMTVDIRYLAERVNPSYKTFTLNLAGVTGFSFKTWPNDASADPQTLTSDTEIFTPGLEILSAETEGKEIKVICNQPLTKYGYSGGELYFSAGSAEVLDESGRAWSMSELEDLSKDYWNDWAARSGCQNI